MEDLGEREQKLLAAAAARHDLEVDQLLDFKVFADRVVIILPTGQKMTYHYADLVGFFTGAAEAPPVDTRKAGRKP